MSEKMNVLFIITDQQHADMLHCYGNPIIKIPNIDKLVKESVRLLIDRKVRGEFLSKKIKKGLIYNSSFGYKINQKF